MKQSAHFLRLLISAIGYAVLSVGIAEAGPSFDCSKAATWSEKAVCKDSRLSDLDREVAALYREAKGRTMPLAQDVLKDAQKEWLGKREKCKQKANAADCLLRVYRRRIDELEGWAGRGPSEEKMAKERARKARPLPEITADVVWDENRVQWREACDFGDFECVLDAIRSSGASGQAVEFAQRVAGWAYEFEELGPVDVVSWVQAFAANVIQGQCLVNGSPDFIDISSYQFTEQDRRRPDVRAVLARLSDGFLANSHFVRKEPRPDGTRFIVEAAYVRCNACRDKALARAEIGYDVNEQGMFQGSRLLQVSIADANEGSKVSPTAGADEPTKADGASMASRSSAAEGVAERCGEAAPFFDLGPGQERCGYGLTAEGGLAYKGQVATDRLVVSALPADRNVATAVRIFSNKSPDGRYQVVWAIRQEPNSEQWTGAAPYIFDAQTLHLNKISLGGPPIEDWYWSPDGAYLAYLYSDEGWFYVQAIGADGVAAQRAEFTQAAGNLVPVREGEGPLLEWRNGTTFGLRVGTCPNADCVEPSGVHYADYGIKDGRIDPVGTEMSAPGLSQAPTPASPPATTTPDRIALKDGSVVTGTILEGQKSPFASTVGTLEIDLAEIRSFAEEAVRLADGSVFKGHFGEGQVTIATSRGELAIPMQEVLSITRGGGAPTTSPVLALPPGQGVLTGRILDNFKQPVGNATIRILGSSLEARTDSDGRYRLNYVPGQLQVAIQAPGYDPTQFALALAGPTEYPVEDKVLLRLPPGPGVFYGDTQGWTELQACTLKITNKIDRGNLWGIGVQKEIYTVKGTPARIGNPRTALFLDNRGPQSGNLVIYRVDKKNEIVTATQSGGLTGALESSDKGTSRVGYGKPQLFPGRAFLMADFGPGVYAIAHLADTCYKFQVGADQPVAAPGAPPAEEVPPAVPEGSEKKKGASAKEEKSNLPKVEKGGSARKQESASKTPKRPPRDTRGSGSHGYTEKQQRALTDFNDM